VAILDIKNLSKNFGHVAALTDVNLSIKEGEDHFPLSGPMAPGNHFL